MVQHLSSNSRHPGFEDLYLKVRAKEHRLLDDALVARLPAVTAGEVNNSEEWKIRAASIARLQDYFKSLQGPKKLMDIGCGNGWAAAALANNALLEVSAIDINLEELEQADRVFQRPNLRFYFGDIFEDIFPEASFDYIVLNSSAQYFSDLAKLVDRSFHYLRAGGELHIVDTPFYEDGELYAAKARTVDYYRSIGCAEMAEHYFHHRFSALAPYHPTYLSGRGVLARIKSVLKPQRQFPWIRIKKPSRP